MADTRTKAEPSAWDELALSERHRAELEASGIKPAVAIERGYRTATTIRQVKMLGFKDSQCLVPGLLIPIHGIAGELTSYQFKSDTPRTDKDGKIIKYENPSSHPSALDVPKRVLRFVLSEEHSLFITEGSKKADSAASREMPCISFPGVWNWRSPSVMSELIQIPLKGRTVYLVWDSDWLRKPHVMAALKHLAGVLRSRGAIVYAITLPEPILGVKVGLDDYFFAGHTPLDLVNHHAIEIEDDGDVSDAANAYANQQEEGRQKLLVEDFASYLPDRKYIYMPTGKIWEPGGIDRYFPPIGSGEDKIPQSEILDKQNPVQDLTWAPGQPQIIENAFLDQGGWVPKEGARVYNAYRPRRAMKGVPEKAARWLDHVTLVYPDSAEHIVDWLAHRVQKPHEKVNHALVLGRTQGIGKDTILEPVRQAVGAWNFGDVSPIELMGRFNAFLKNVILRVSELRDLGDRDRYGFYEHTKTLIAAPPDTVLIDEKHIRAYRVPNLIGVIFTTNHRTDGLFLPADDRRHYVAWSELTPDDFPEGYWADLYRWFNDDGEGGAGAVHVASCLATWDISDFNPKAPPPKTAAFWDIVAAGRAPEDADMADAIAKITASDADAITVRDVERASDDLEFKSWLKDRKNSRQIPHRFEAAGYVAISNPTAKDGLWVVNGKRQVVYARKDLVINQRIDAARKRTAQPW